MIEISFKPSFVRQVKLLEEDLFEEVIEKIEFFKYKKNHSSLKVHKLHGKLSGCWSFSVNYKIRVVFQYLSKTEIVLLAVGDHDVYKA